MATNISILVLAMIAAGMGIMLYQRRKYFYLGTFFIGHGMTSTVINLKNSGHYVINITNVSENPQAPASFKIEEGSFRKDGTVIDLKPEKLSTFTYPNSQALTTNDWGGHEESESESHQISLQNHALMLSGEELQPLNQGKVVTVKQFMQNKKKPKSAKV
ncbi:hypothetical protein [Lacticaseibacillus zeae]|uniref:Uncharacterized protein n=1 Tax=Lacticaseibacillus zeae subsp. silagei TaxID=3068307 RepID=A0ABD7ZB56_LACZE|nr:MULTISPECIES: hypothetical protein [Lacticaseibacillus]MDE3314580.1 hypothetical protein [Lacticaseibacillus zeae]OFR92017.1 hypothetical protein HMPREF2861_12035 [Lactobacillus sp. HMSC068F07]WLV84202.1 hypothetical protein LACZS2_000618 [Lacticaseibacillus sp. NCIMB 15475]WLV86958.1 hypothetical protein LACZS1_000618 [Lacticaseibacillus sp. NCIMB 15474]